MLKKMLLLTGFLLFVALLYIGVYGVVIYQEAKNTLGIDQYTIQTNQTAQPVLDEGSVAKVDLLKNYFLITPEIFNEWLNRNSALLNTSNELVHMVSAVQLPGSYTNSCDFTYCLQFRRPFSEIPFMLWQGLIGVEDNRYLQHIGIDYISLLRALIADIKALKLVQGGSTITQQLVKNLFLSSEKKFSRKFKEMIFSIYLESNYTKEDILKLYLNEFVWGSLYGLRIKGFHAASIVYFGKNPSLLTSYEIAILVAMINGPNYFHPLKNTKRLRDKVATILNRLKEVKIVSKYDDSTWDDKQWQKYITFLKNDDRKIQIKTLWEATLQSKDILNSFQVLNLVNGVSEVKALNQAKIHNADIGVKIIVKDLFCKDCSEFKYYSKSERNQENAIKEERHQTGSLLKPFIYQKLYEKFSFSWDDGLSNEPIELKLKSGSWIPRDYAPAKSEVITVREALQQSKNIALIRLVNSIGWSNAEEVFTPYFNSLKRPLAEYPSQLLGAIEFSMKEVLDLYKNLIVDTCLKIKDHQLEFEDTFLYVLSNPNQTTIKNVAVEPIRKLRFFGKTGTSNNGQDSWFIGFDGRILFLAWMGLETARNDQSLGLSGSGAAFRIFQNHILYQGKQLPEYSCDGV